MKGLCRTPILGIVFRLDCGPPRAAGRRQPATERKRQYWKALATVRPGVAVRLLVHATESEKGEITAELDSPDEGAKGLELSSVTINESRLAFELKVSAAKFEGTMNAAGTEAAGTWTQRGAEFPLTLVKKGKPRRAESRGTRADLGRRSWPPAPGLSSDWRFAPLRRRTPERPWARSTAWTRAKRGSSSAR